MSGFMGFWIAKRMREQGGIDQSFERKRPKMPSTPWRAAAVISFTIGALGVWLLFPDSNVVVLRMLGGGLVTFVVGMIVVETVWERSHQRRTNAPPSPIGKRR